FRWWTYRKHLRRAPAGEWVVSEFLPPVGWSGYGNTIACPLIHHVKEGRWLRDPAYLDGYLATMAAKGNVAGPKAYANCLAWSTLDRSRVTGDDALALRLLDAFVANYERWEKGWNARSLSLKRVANVRHWKAFPIKTGFRPERGLFDFAGDREGSEFALSDDGARPMQNAMMWAEATAIAELARRRGDGALAGRFAAKARDLERNIKEKLWNPARKFFTVLSIEGRQDDVCELHGYAPFYFEMPLDARYDAAFAGLSDERGFLAPHGLTFPRRDTPGFEVGVFTNRHECLWNGPSWPYATSVALTAFANRLHGTARTPANAAAYRRLLRQYAVQQRMTLPDGTVVPWIDENYDPFRQEWLARAVMREWERLGIGKQKWPERGKDYNHSTYCDLVISGLVGFLPSESGGFAVDPLADPSWDSWSLTNLRYRGHDVDIRWKRGDGFAISVDGVRVAHRDRPERVDVPALPERAPAVLATCDVVVAGGGAAGVAAAVAAKAAGADVFVVSARPYLGEDLAGKLRLAKEADDDLSSPLAQAIYAVRGRPLHQFGGVTPIQIKRVCDEALVKAGIPFLAWTIPVGVARDEAGRVAGVWVVNRGGRQLVRAKVVVDATERATMARSAGAAFRPFPAGAQDFTRYVISGDRPPDAVASVGEPQPVDARGRGQLAPAADAPGVVTARMWRCELKIPMADGSARAFARAEQIARDRTWTRTTVDAADTLLFDPPDTLIADVADVFTCGPAAGRRKPGESLTAAAKIGREAAAAAKRRTQPAARLRQMDDLPLLATCDVLVAGGGTGGAPAAIGAARKGMKTILCEYSHRLGGVMTDGGIGLYCFGLRVGFTEELDRALKKMGSVYGVCKAEWLRRQAREAGAEIWLGALVADVLMEGDAVVGAVVAFADGTCGRVLCKAAIDATGNADLAFKAGEATEFIDDAELSVQGAGSTPRILGKSYQNTDSQFVDDTDVADLTYFWLRARTSFGHHVWDQAQVVNSRERRRMVGAFYVTVQDAMGGRTYPDVIGLTRSNFDTHGQTVDPQFFVEDPGRAATTVHLPYRCILPRKTDGLLTIGLGMSAHRDAMPILRMQPDVQNQGYAAGLAAAQSVSRGVRLRAIDVKALQRELVAKGIVPEAVLTMTDNYPLSDEALAAAVRELGADYKDLAKVLSDPRRARPLLVQAYCDPPSPAGAPARLVYAHVLGLLGDRTGAADLVAAVESAAWDEGWNYRGMGQFGRSVSQIDSYLIALGRSRADEGLAAAVGKARQLTAANRYSHFRAVALALEGMGDARGADVLAELLLKPGVGGHALAPGALPKIAGYERNVSHLGIADDERTLCLRELCLARALFRLGDRAGLGERTLRAYADDPRRAYANHAKKVLGAVGRRAEGGRAE
ncbi:MAG: FAD-dependent oxidoreductase, partial [Kiritimatiellia bacterium]